MGGTAWLTVSYDADDDYYESHPMDNRVHRTPSPAHPLQHGYHLEDNPYGHSPLDIPPQGPGRFSPGDSLQMQMPVSTAYREAWAVVAKKRNKD